ncbi:MAG: complex I subunit 5 family protein, partial [Brachybacterium sp.]|nr:complex I subunit 5 family protein [Brachybacterium sp.]
MMLLSALAAPLLPVLLIAGAGILRPGPRDTARRLVAIASPLAIVPAVLLALLQPGAELHLPWVLMGTHLELDSVARPLLLIAALLYGAALSSLSWVKLRDTERSTGALTSFLLMSFVGNIGAYLAADSVTFYLAFALMSFSAVGLVMHYRTRSALRATIIYLVMSVLSETAILGALLLIVAGGGMLIADAPAAAADSHPYLIAALLLFGFGVKAGTVPLHVWLPLAHPAAPPAASAVLSGAMVKAGLVGWIRFLPDGEVAPDPVHTIGWVLLILALIGAMLAALVGVLQDDPKVVLAYSTISQMGFIGAVVAVGLLEPSLMAATTAAAIVYACHHGLAKGALFLAVPVVKHYGNRGPVGVVVLLGVAIASLAIAGAPLTSGALGKYIAKDVAESITVLGLALDDLLALVATGSTLLLVRFGLILWRQKREPRSAPDGEFASWVVIVLASVLVPWLITDQWTPAPIPEWSAYTVWTATWPILLGVALGGAVLLLATRGRLPRWTPRADASLIPPGDLVVAEEALVQRLQDRSSGPLRLAEAGALRAQRSWSGFWYGAAALTRRAVGALDGALARWESSGIVMII